MTLLVFNVYMWVSLKDNLMEIFIQDTFFLKKKCIPEARFCKGKYINFLIFFSFNLIQNKTTDKIEFALSLIPLKNC